MLIRLYCFYNNLFINLKKLVIITLINRNLLILINLLFKISNLFKIDLFFYNSKIFLILKTNKFKLFSNNTASLFKLIFNKSS